MDKEVMLVVLREAELHYLWGLASTLETKTGFFLVPGDLRLEIARRDPAYIKLLDWSEVLTLTRCKPGFRRTVSWLLAKVV